MKQVANIFPFVIGDFHTDDGSKYLNSKVAELLENLRIEQTDSVARQTNDDVVAESKDEPPLRELPG